MKNCSNSSNPKKNSLCGFYLCKVSISLTTLWLFYKLLLERESFFQLNRIYLLLTLGLSLGLPFVSLPAWIGYQEVVGSWMAPPAPAVVPAPPVHHLAAGSSPISLMSLLRAVKNQDYEIVGLLLAKKADPILKATGQESALERVQQMNDPQLLDLFDYARDHFAREY